MRVREEEGKQTDVGSHKGEGMGKNKKGGRYSKRKRPRPEKRLGRGGNLKNER